MATNTYLQQLPFYQSLNQAEQKILQEHARTLYYAPKTIVQLTADECHGLIIVKQGWLRIFMTSESGREITLFQLREYDDCILSASCMFENISFNSSIESLVGSEVIIIPSHILAQLSKEHFEIQRYFLMVSQKRLSEVMWVVDQVVFQSFDRRLTQFLQQQQKLAGTNKLHLTHEQIAQHVGSAREVVSRMLKYFEREGYVKIGRGTIEIIALPEL